MVIGKIVEMDECYFPGKLKFNRGRRLGEDSESSWKVDKKWVFAMTERDSLDALSVQVKFCFLTLKTIA